MKIEQLLVEKGSPARLARRAAERAAKAAAGNVQPNTAGASAFGNIANTLTPDPTAPAASSSGGVTTPTSTGQIHKAAATNPNQPPVAPPGQPEETPPEQTASAAAPGTTLAQKAKTGLANTVGGASTAIGAVGGGIRGALSKMKQGYQAGRAAVAGPETTITAPAAGASAPAASSAAPAAAPTGGNQISQLANRVSELEKAVGIAESYKFESKFLGKLI